MFKKYLKLTIEAEFTRIVNAEEIQAFYEQMWETDNARAIIEQIRVEKNGKKS